MYTHAIRNREKELSISGKEVCWIGEGNQRLGLRIRGDPESLHFNSHYRLVFPAKTSPRGKPCSPSLSFSPLSLGSRVRARERERQKTRVARAADGDRLAENEIERRAATRREKEGERERREQIKKSRE